MSNFLLKIKRYQNGLGLFTIGIAAYFIIYGNPLNDFQLMSRGVTVQGIATDVNDFEDREDNGNVSRYFFIKYEFTTATGQKISDVVEVQGTSSNRGFRTGQTLDIQYLTDAPDVHRVKALASTTLTGWMLKNLLLGILAIAPGLYFLYRSYQLERKRGEKSAG
ncbi:MAG: DUF3592 domain-containing protein [Cyclobacteriaceae bacterium]|nr:DUF3592 domain-containing protein [Cyclobacteriaceae bacterium]